MDNMMEARKRDGMDVWPETRQCGDLQLRLVHHRVSVFVPHFSREPRRVLSPTPSRLTSVTADASRGIIKGQLPFTTYTVEPLDFPA